MREKQARKFEIRKSNVQFPKDFLRGDFQKPDLEHEKM